MLTQHGDDRQQRAETVAEQTAIRGLLLLLRECLEDALLGLRPEARERAQLLLLRRHFELVHRRDAELLPYPRCRLRTEPREAHEGDDLRRDHLLALRQRMHLAVLDDLDDLLLDRLADP